MHGIRKHPSQGAVLLWGTAWSAVHFVVTDWLTERHPSLVRWWEGLTIVSTGYWVAHKQHIGVRPLGENDPPPGKCLS